MKRIVFSLFQPATLALIVLLWASAPASLLDKAWAITAASIATLAMVQALEFANERHAGWRQSPREFLTDLFYVILYYAVIVTVETKLADDPLASAKHALGITTAWAMHLPFVVQVALVVFLVEFGQYWMHRLMHNSFVWWTHAPHHHITQLNAAKGLVGNPLELFLVSLSVIALFDLPKNAVFLCVQRAHRRVGLRSCQCSLRASALVRVRLHDGRGPQPAPFGRLQRNPLQLRQCVTALRSPVRYVS